MDSISIQEPSKDEPTLKDPMQILEEALTLCKFGKFHIKLLAATLCSTVAVMLVTTTSAFILPVAECDLNMNIMQKGLLNAMPFFGQMGASLFAGFLTDAFGRKISLVGGNASLFIFTVIEGSSQTYVMLLLMKFLEGISLSVCYSTISTNLTEFCHIGVRDRIFMLYSSFSSLGQIVAVIMAWLVLPIQFNHTFFQGYFEIHSWNLYLYVCSVWSFIAFVIFLYIPESPKFLLSHAQEKEALEVLKTMYSENSGKNKKSFPILSFNTSGTVKPSANISLKQQIVNGLFEVKGLFRRPLFLKLLLFSSITFAALIVFTSLRLWYPQIATIIENYGKMNGETARFCVMINDYMQNLDPSTAIINKTDSYECVPILSGQETYINGLIMGLIALISVGISGVLVDYFGQRLVMFILLITCAVCSTALHWANASSLIAILISVTCSFILTSLCLMQNLLVRFFPTTLRGLAVSIIIMIGRIGSLAGNILFPVLLKMGCMTPFITTAVISLGIAGLVYFLPNVNKDNKETGDN